MKLSLEEVPVDYRIITSLVAEKSTVLDLGCGDGTLMCLLSQEKKSKSPRGRNR